jgi:hypothetical protein
MRRGGYDEDTTTRFRTCRAWRGRHRERTVGHRPDHRHRQGYERSGGARGYCHRHQRADGREARNDHGPDRQLRGPAPAGQRVLGDGAAAGLPPGQADRRPAQCGPGGPRRPGAANRKPVRDGRGPGGGGRARHRDGDDRPGDQREADHRPAAQWTELPAAPLPRRRGRGGRRRAGRHAPGRGQRDQHHGIAPDLEQLHDRRDFQRRYRPGHSGRDSLRGRDPGVQGADQDLLR